MNIALVKELAARHVELYAWSTAGAEYARRATEELGIATCFVGFVPKPDALLDDRAIGDWRLVEMHPAQCAMASADELLARMK